MVPNWGCYNSTPLTGISSRDSRVEVGMSENMETLNFNDLLDSHADLPCCRDLAN